jgi:hypothetical protein
MKLDELLRRKPPAAVPMHDGGLVFVLFFLRVCSSDGGLR